MRNILRTLSKRRSVTVCIAKSVSRPCTWRCPRSFVRTWCSTGTARSVRCFSCVGPVVSKGGTMGTMIPDTTTYLAMALEANKQLMNDENTEEPKMCSTCLMLRQLKKFVSETALFMKKLGHMHKRLRQIHGCEKDDDTKRLELQQLHVLETLYNYQISNKFMTKFLMENIELVLAPAHEVIEQTGWGEECDCGFCRMNHGRAPDIVPLPWLTIDV